MLAKRHVRALDLCPPHIGGSCRCQDHSFSVSKVTSLMLSERCERGLGGEVLCLPPAFLFWSAERGLGNRRLRFPREVLMHFACWNMID